MPASTAIRLVETLGDEEASLLASSSRPVLEAPIGESMLFVWSHEKPPFAEDYAGSRPRPGVPLMAVVSRVAVGTAFWMPPFGRFSSTVSLPGVDFDVYWTVATPLGVLRWRQELRDGAESASKKAPHSNHMEIRVSYSTMLRLLYQGEPLSSFDQTEMRFSGPLGALSSFVALMHGENAIRLNSLAPSILACLQLWAGTARQPLYGS